MANDYRFQAAVREGIGTITVDGQPIIADFYTEGDVLTLAVTLGDGYHTALWYTSPGNTFLSSSLSFSFTMPGEDVKIYVVLTGENAPVNDYGLKYEGGYGTNYGGNAWNLQIFQQGYVGSSTPLLINDITYNWGNTGNDPLETIIGSSVDFTIAGETGDFNEFLVGGNRTWKVVLNEIGANNDITDWNISQAGHSALFKSVTFGNNKFVAVTSFKAYTSTNGTTWTETNTFSGVGIYDVTFGNGLFVAVGWAISGSTVAGVFTSPDGVTWTSRTPAANQRFEAVTYGGGKFVAVANPDVSGDTNLVMYSSDGITWTSSTILSRYYTGIAYGAGTYVAVANTLGGFVTNLSSYSFDLVTWYAATNGGSSSNVIYADGKFVTGGSYSTDGINWSFGSGGFAFQGLTYGNGYFVGVRSNLNNLYYSTNGITWSNLSNILDSDGFVSLTFGNNKFVGVSQNDSSILCNFQALIKFFTGYIAPDFITSQFKSGLKLYEFTAIDGLKGLDSIRSNNGAWPDPRTHALSAVVGALNQSFVDKRNVTIGCEVHETRMDSAISVFKQFNVPLNAVYTDGEIAKFSNAVRIENETLYLKETIERMVNPFLCRVFLWKDQFYVIRLNEFLKTDYKAYTFDPNQSLLLTETILNGDDINADINLPEETARRVFTEFNAFLNLGVLDKDSQGGVFDAKFESAEWFVMSPASAYPGTYHLSLWDYHNAIPSNQPSSVPSGNTALVQYVSDNSGEYCQIWTTTTTSGISDPNISWISANTNTTGGAITIAQETANTISLTFEYMVERVGSAYTVTPPAGTHSVGLMIKIGNQYLYRDTATTFDWTGTATVMQFAVTTGSAWNSIAINNVLVPVDGEVEIRLYQLICSSGTANRYVIRYDNISLKIEKTDGLSLSKLGVKAVTGSPYANVHPDYNTYIGDAITANSASAIRLLTSGEPVSEGWSRDGVEDLPLLDIIVQELANLKGRTNYRILGTLERRDLQPWRAFLLNDRYWALVSYSLNCRTGTAQVELYDLGIEPTT
jgi:hypothetical protein